MRAPKLALFTLITFSLTILASPSAWAKETAVSLKSGYLANPAEGGYTVEIVGVLGKSGTLILNPNAAMLNAFGDIGARTEMASRSFSIQLVEVRSPDPRNLGRRLFAITGKDLPGEWSLVLPAKAGPGARLILKKDRRLRVIPMSALPQKKAPKAKKAPKLSALPRAEKGEAKYTAVYKNGELVLTAKGEAPTPGFKIALEQSEKDPTKFELWWVPPKGMVIMVLAPFEVELRVKLAKKPRKVSVQEGQGLRTVPVS